MFEKFGPWKFVKELYRQAREHFIDRPERFKRWNDETQAGLAAEEEFLTDGHNHKLEERMKIWGNLEDWKVGDTARDFGNKITERIKSSDSDKVARVGEKDEQLVRYLLGTDSLSFRIKGGETDMVRKSRITGVMRTIYTNLIGESGGLTHEQALGKTLDFFDPREGGDPKEGPGLPDMYRWLTAFVDEEAVAWMRPDRGDSSGDIPIFDMENQGTKNLGIIYEKFGEMEGRDQMLVARKLGLHNRAISGTVREYSNIRVADEPGQPRSFYVSDEIDTTMCIPRVAGKKGTAAWDRTAK